jgi:hypothetical protein
MEPALTHTLARTSTNEDISSMSKLCLHRGEFLQCSTYGRVRDRGCQMAYFQTKNSYLGKFWRDLQWKMPVYIFYVYLVYFLAIWNTLWPFGIFYIWCFLEHFFPFWYVVQRKIWQPCSGPLWPSSLEKTRGEDSHIFSEHLAGGGENGHDINIFYFSPPCRPSRYPEHLMRYSTYGPDTQVSGGPNLRPLHLQLQLQDVVVAVFGTLFDRLSLYGGINCYVCFEKVKLAPVY